MIKKLFFLSLILICCVVASLSYAEGGKVILDLNDNNFTTKKMSMPVLIEMGWNYIQDVKEYDKQLEGKSIEKDFSEDIKSKYPHYGKDMADKWHKYVKKGVKGYRTFQDLKKIVVSWLMKQETPLVVSDDQYEMGGAEDYIESDAPVIIHDFKKVVAYSNLEKDKMSAKDKIAREKGLPRPVEIISKYKKALMEKDWATLFDFKWRDYLKNLYEYPEGKNAIENQKLKAFVLSRYNGIGANGVVEGVIEIVPQSGNFVLLSNYKDYKGLSVEFVKGNNLDNINVNFVMPQQINDNENRVVLGYSSKFPIYFRADVKDIKKLVKLSPVIKANVCSDNNCEEIQLNPELDLYPKDDVKETTFATHVIVTSQNIPHESNKKYFDFERLILEKGEDDKGSFLKLNLSADDAPYFKVFIIGNFAKYFEIPQIGIDGDEIIVRFKLIDKEFDPIGKEIIFWVSTNSNTQYLHKMIVKEPSMFDIEGKGVSLGVLGLAFIGGLLLNLMPCVFPVLSLKLLAFTKFGGLNKVSIRRNFFYNSLGILCSFLVIAFGLALLKISGQTLGWGMQFQNIYFLATVIWVVALFLAHVVGLVDLKAPLIANKVLDKVGNQGRLFEFLSGIFLVLLSTPCMAPYLGTAFGVALAGNVIDIVVTVCVVGFGLAFPYILIASCPDIAVYMPRPGKWMNWINMAMIMMLLITLAWLIGILTIQTSNVQIWHWIGYIVVAFIILAVWKVVKIEFEKMRDMAQSKSSYRINFIFVIIIIGLVVISFVDVKKDMLSATEVTKQEIGIDLLDEDISRNLRIGHKVLVKVTADWCLTCKYNDAFVFDVEYMMDSINNNGVVIYEINWTQYSKKVLEYMQRFGRNGLPFYVLFSRRFPAGIVLPEMLNIRDLQTLIEM